MKTQTGTTETLQSILEALPPNEPIDVTLVLKTVPRMNKTNNPFWGKLWKISTFSGKICSVYSKQVQKQREREGGLEIVDGKPQFNEVEIFRAKKRAWGERLPDSPFVEHKGNFYLDVQAEEVQDVEYRDDKNLPVVGEKLEEAKSFEPKKSKSKRQKTDTEIIWRTPMLKNVIALTLHDSKMTFIVDNESQRKAA